MKIMAVYNILCCVLFSCCYWQNPLICHAKGSR